MTVDGTWFAQMYIFKKQYFFMQKMIQTVFFLQANNFDIKESNSSYIFWHQFYSSIENICAATVLILLKTNIKVYSKLYSGE